MFATWAWVVVGLTIVFGWVLAYCLARAAGIADQAIEAAIEAGRVTPDENTSLEENRMTGMETTEPIRVELTETHSLTRRPCAVCNGNTEKEAVNAGFTIDGGDARHIVCEECLKAGAYGIPGRLRLKAMRLESWASDLRELADRAWILPSHEEWERANDAHGDRLLEDAEEEQRAKKGNRVSRFSTNPPTSRSRRTER